MQINNRSTKIITREHAKEIERKGLSIGFTSGAFDLIHSTHIDLLKKAKERCDILIVGVNSDASIKKYKGYNRPIKSEEERISILAAVSYIDYLFIFDEINNHNNIIELKPNFYFKGKDYKKANLSSASLVERNGGEVIILDTSIQISSSKIIESIIAKELTIRCSIEHIYDGIVMIDRDGVINKEINYLHNEKDFEFIDGTIEAIKKLNDNNIAVVVITNQPGIGLNLYTEEDFFNVNKKMIQEIHKAGARIDKVYYCPDTHNSRYKKPNSGMLIKAFCNLNIKKNGKIFMIGDRRSDAMAAKTQGIISIGVLTGKALQDTWIEEEPDLIYNNLLESVNGIVK